MLTYPLTERGAQPLYEFLADRIRMDIDSGRLVPGERLPSRRSLSDHLGISTVTVEAAYRLLTDTGLIEARARRGYYVAARGTRAHPAGCPALSRAPGPRDNGSPLFPYATWARIIRDVLHTSSERSLSSAAGAWGAPELREALSAHLADFAGLDVSPDAIVVGAGAQALTSLLILTLSPAAIYALEDPGYPALAALYRAHRARWRAVGLDEQGLSLEALRATDASVAHVSPASQFPTGIAMSLPRRYELLAWAAGAPERVLIEDDYAGELADASTPSLAALDVGGHVIGLHSFTLTLGAGFRLGYMVLPERLRERFDARLGFASCTVSALDQLALARFLASGAYERHVARLRTTYRALGEQLAARLSPAGVEVTLASASARAVLSVDPARSDRLARALTYAGARCQPLADYAIENRDRTDARLLLDYRRLPPERLDRLVARVR